jgi:LysR family transcriptional activator of nhaA
VKWLNYNHLYYFWMVVREGGVVRAAEELTVSQPTVSAQLKDLEAALGHRLFDRVGRGLVLTEAGRIAFNYANEMFSLGQELSNALEHQTRGIALRLATGVVDVIPKPVARHLLAPAVNLYWFGVLRLMAARGPTFEIDWDFVDTPFSECQVFAVARKPRGGLA